jgi:hypothetical protein
MSALRELTMAEQDMVSGGFDITVLGNVDFSVYDPNNFVANFDAGGNIYSIQYYKYGEDDLGGQSGRFGGEGLEGNGVIAPNLSGAIAATGSQTINGSATSTVLKTFFPNGQVQSITATVKINWSVTTTGAGQIKATGGLGGPPPPKPRQETSKTRPK